MARTYPRAAGVIDDIFKSAWQKKMDGCDKRLEPAAGEKLEGCYLDLYEAVLAAKTDKD